MKGKSKWTPILCSTYILMAELLFMFMWCNTAWTVEEIPKYRTRSQTGCHTSGIYPATKRIQNQETSSGYSVDVCPGDTTIFRAPKVILRPGFRAERGSRFRAGIPVFDVHFAVLEDIPDAPKTRAEFQSIIDTLNEGFKTEDNKKLIRFRLKSFTTWQMIDNAKLDPGDDNEDPCVYYVHISGDGFNFGTFTGYFGDGTGSSCSTSGTIIRDPQALNCYIYDVSNDEGHGRRNSGYPLIILDIDRINNPGPLKRQSPEAHEMGHAFGLAHICDDNVDSIDDNSNIMGSKYLCSIDLCDYSFSSPFSGGNRLIGFAHDPYIECAVCNAVGPTICQEYQNPSQPRIGQVQLILWYAEQFGMHFGFTDSWSSVLPIRLPCATGTCSYYP